MSWLIALCLTVLIIIQREREKRLQERFNEAIRTIERLQGVRREEAGE